MSEMGETTREDFEALPPPAMERLWRPAGRATEQLSPTVRAFLRAEEREILATWACLHAELIAAEGMRADLGLLSFWRWSVEAEAAAMRDALAAPLALTPVAAVLASLDLSAL